jgi:K+:H+ antiporter
VSAALAQIGEFSFILSGLGVNLDLVPAEELNFIVASALLSINFNPGVVTAAIAFASRDDKS